ncbi:MAG: ATP-binding protein [Cupriavidus sp.]|nr:MAG: ATP-binding protein [Cupriavidus sp.]
MSPAFSSCNRRSVPQRAHPLSHRASHKRFRRQLPPATRYLPSIVGLPLLRPTMYAETLRFNTLRLLSGVRTLISVLLVLACAATAKPGVPFANGIGPVMDTAMVLMLFGAYFVVVLLTQLLGGIRTWSWIPVPGAAALIYLARGWDNVAGYKEVVAIACLLWCAALVRFMFSGAPQEQAKALAASSENMSDANAKPQADIRYTAVRTKTTFASVEGMDDLKARLLEAGQEIVTSGKQGKKARNGVLLTGDPGNGKSLMAEALAGQLKLPFLSATFGDMGSRFINETTENLVRVFRDARAQAPCVLFLDEVDSFLRDRNSALTTSEEGPKTVATFLTEVVNLRSAGVVVIAATNLRDELDAAAIREGRFDFKIEVPAPDLKARVGLIRRGAKAFGDIHFEEAGIEQAAKRWSGFSVARILAVVEQAGRDARKMHAYSVSYRELQEAMRTVQGRKGKLAEDTPTLDQLTMRPEIKEALEAVAHRMINIEEIEELGGTAPTGLQFAGPPGTGKTLSARALAKTTGWAFLERSGNELIGKPDAIDALVKEARDIRPVIVFIDEADDVLRDRAYSQPHVVSATNKLLQAIDGAAGKVHDVLWIAATNHPEQLDSAATRGGRFTEKLYFELPGEQEIAAYVSTWMRNSKIALDAAVTVEACSAVFAGQPIANVKEALQAAVNAAISRRTPSGAPKLTLQDISSGLVRVTG